MSDKRPSDEIDGDFRSFTLSLSTPLPPLAKSDKAPVSKPVRDQPLHLGDSSDRDPQHEHDELMPKKKPPGWSGQLFPNKPRHYGLVDR